MIVNNLSLIYWITELFFKKLFVIYEYFKILFILHPSLSFIAKSIQVVIKYLSLMFFRLIQYVTILSIRSLAFQLKYVCTNSGKYSVLGNVCQVWCMSIEKIKHRKH